MGIALHCHKCGAALDASARTGVCGVCASCLEKLGLAAWLDDETLEEANASIMRGEVRRFGDYELLEEIARGGMGIVYRARQLSLKRIVALKMIAPERMTQPKTAERFQLEAEAAAKLDHPNIVPIHEIGEHDGRHYYTMKLVDGRSLARELNGQPLPPRRAAKWIAAIACALHYAHQRGVLHRDIKPGNILIDSDGRPHLLDFGLAKLIEADSTLTQTEAVLGSPAYMAPEQASGRAKQLTVAADIYSLGAVLYEALTGRPPFRGETALETMRRVVEQEPDRPTTLHSSVDRDLETVCLKCLEKEPVRRYASAAALAEDLERWSRHEPIQARPTTAWQRAVKWTRRKPAIAALTAAVVAVGVAGLLGVLWQWQRANSTAARERQERRAAQANLYAADMVLAGLALQKNDLGNARTLLARHEPPAKSEIRDPKSELDLRGWEWRYIKGQCQSDELFSLPGHHRSVDVQFISTNLLASGGSDGTIRIWDLARRQARLHNHGSPVQRFRVSPDGRWFVANDENAKKMFVWDRESLGVVYSTPSATDSGGRPDFLPDGRTVFFSQSSSKVARLTLGPGEPRVQSWFELSGIGSLACSPDGKRLAIAAAGQILIQNLEDDTTIGVQYPDGSSALAGAFLACFSPDSRHLILLHGQTVHLADARTGDWLRSHHHHQANVSGVALTPDGRLLISVAHDQAIWFQDMRTWTPVAQYRGHADEIHSVTVSPDGRLLATGAKDGSIKIWNAHPKVRTDPLQVVLAQFGRVHFTPKADRFVTVQSAASGSEITVWDTATTAQLGRLFVQGDSILDAALLGAGKQIALVRKDESVEVWDLATQGRVSLLVPPSDKRPVGWALTVSVPWLWEVDGGRHLVCMQGVYGITTWTGAEERGPLNLHLVDLATMKVVRSFRFPFGFGVTGGNCSPDGKAFVVGGHDGEIVVFSLLDGRAVLSTNAHSYALMKIDFLPERQLMATAGMDGYLQLWDTETWKVKSRLRADPHEIYSVAFHPDGTRVATGATGDAPLTLWDVNSGRELARLPSTQKGLFNRLTFIDQDTLVGWVGNPVPGLGDEVVVWRAPSLNRIEAAVTAP